MQLKEVWGMQWRDTLTFGDKPDIGSYGCSLGRKDPINLKDNFVGISGNFFLTKLAWWAEEDERHLVGLFSSWLRAAIAGSGPSAV